MLIVDNSAMNRVLLKSATAGYDASAAADGGDAIEYIRKKHKTLFAVLPDIMMPLTDGYEMRARASRMDVLGDYIVPCLPIEICTLR